MLRDAHRVNIEDLNTVPVRISNHGVGNGTLNVLHGENHAKRLLGRNHFIRAFDRRLRSRIIRFDYMPAVNGTSVGVNIRSYVDPRQTTAVSNAITSEDDEAKGCQCKYQDQTSLYQ